MGSRPEYIDLRPGSPASSSVRSYLDLPSPRTGDIPPALSPLDALAQQGRLLARRFEESNKDGRRLSRLPSVTVENEMVRARPDYFRSLSAGTENANDESPLQVPENSSGSPQNVREVNPDNRPVSQYPVLHADEPAPPQRLALKNDLPQVTEEQASPRSNDNSAHNPHPHNDYFSIPRTESPDSFHSRAAPAADGLRYRNQPQQYQKSYQHNYSSHNKSPQTYPPTFMRLANEHGHGPRRGPLGMMPKSPAPSNLSRTSLSVRSVPGDGSDVDASSVGGSVDSLPQRGLSTNSSYSRTHSPVPPRSPSVSSEYSVGGTRRSRPSHNFSRPAGSHPPSRQHSDDSVVMRPSYDEPPYLREATHTPLSMVSDDQDSQNQPAQSYIYAKYALPRGRSVDRESIDAAAWLNQQWTLNSPPGTMDIGRPQQKPQPKPQQPPQRLNRPPSPASPPRTSDGTPIAKLPRPSVSLPHRTSSFDDVRRAKPRSESVPPPPSPSLYSSNATIRGPAPPMPMTPGSAPASVSDMSPEEHLDIGIDCHESGSLSKSTYHLRIAARGGHPTAMLLYALACRHGWGMRPNQAEGVRWLKQAVDCAQLEVADDENPTKRQDDGKPRADVLERRAHKAQFALSVYELGMSYSKGWGVSQDRALALRCFEIAGSWGDADALAEAGFCYAEGLGCRKDMKKAARLYRAAAAKGVSMTGNSWIYKDKYMDDSDKRHGGNRPGSGGKDKKGVDTFHHHHEDRDRARGRSQSTVTPEKKKPRDKSRTRTIFGRKKSFAVPTE